MILKRNTDEGRFQLEGEDEITDVLEIAAGSLIVEVDGDRLLVDAADGKVYELTPVENLEIEDDYDFDVEDEDDEDDEDEEEDEEDEDE